MIASSSCDVARRANRDPVELNFERDPHYARVFSARDQQADLEHVQAGVLLQVQELTVMLPQS